MDSPAHDSPAGDSPAGDSPAGDSPAGDSPAGDSPAGDSPAGDSPAGDSPTHDSAAQDSAQPAEAAAPAGRLRRPLGVAVVVVFLGFGIWAVARQWDDVRAVIGELSPQAVGLAGVAVLAAIFANFLSWRALLAGLGGQVAIVGAMRIFFVGQVGKYLPGKVWPILTQIKLGREYGVSRKASAAAALVFMLVNLGTGLLVALCALPALGSDALGGYWWTLFALPVALAVLWPPVLNRLLNTALRLARREPLPQPLGLGAAVRAAGWALVAWSAYGAHLWALLTDLGADEPGLYVRAVGAFAGAWSIGFLLAVTPAGVGPREVALVVLLASTVAAAPAMVAAVVSRLLITLGDLVWPLVALVLHWRRGRVVRAATAMRSESVRSGTDDQVG